MGMSRRSPSSAGCRCRPPYDNTTIAVAKICGDGKRERTRAFTELLSHYLFRDRFGRPGKGNDKGKVEVHWSARYKRQTCARPDRRAIAAVEYSHPVVYLRQVFPLGGEMRILVFIAAVLLLGASALMVTEPAQAGPDPCERKIQGCS